MEKMSRRIPLWGNLHFRNILRALLSILGENRSNVDLETINAKRIALVDDTNGLIEKLGIILSQRH